MEDAKPRLPGLVPWGDGIAAHLRWELLAGVQEGHAGAELARTSGSMTHRRSLETTAAIVTLASSGREDLDGARKRIPPIAHHGAQQRTTSRGVRESRSQPRHVSQNRTKKSDISLELCIANRSHDLRIDRQMSRSIVTAHLKLGS